MADGTGIEWTDATWNPVRGCSRVSEGCRHCYAEPIAARFSGAGRPYEGLAKFVTAPDGAREARWTGQVRLVEEQLLVPVGWVRPRRIFVNSMSDLFHERLDDAAIDEVFAIMAMCPQHTFQVLTKRPERMRAYIGGSDVMSAPATERIGWLIHRWMNDFGDLLMPAHWGTTSAALLFGSAPGHAIAPRPDVWPLKNVWLGVSVENQAAADARRPALAAIAEHRWTTFVSYEPALGPVDWRGWAFLRWLISGGESGPKARPSHPDWHRAARDVCAAHGIAYLFKQWGEWAAVYDRDRDDPDWRRCDVVERETPRGRWLNLAGGHGFHGDRVIRVDRVGKKKAGRQVDGVEHNAFPEEKRIPA